MKVLYVGPTLPDAKDYAGDIRVRGPAVQGDIFRAVEEGATVIGLVDGGFEYTAPVWHKEILYALSAGTRVLGAASMGALRAAECHSFGMTGVGGIFEEYRDGMRVDDSDVAQIHGPVELGWLPLSEPLVNIEATLGLLRERQFISSAEASHLEDVAGAMFFKDRTWRSILVHASLLENGRSASIANGMQSCHVNRKRADAIALLDVMSRLDAKSPAPRPDWQFQHTSLWNEMRKHHPMAKEPGDLS